jgi:hypothetical protein
MHDTGQVNYKIQDKSTMVPASVRLCFYAFSQQAASCHIMCSLFSEFVLTKHLLHRYKRCVCALFNYCGECFVNKSYK